MGSIPSVQNYPNTAVSSARSFALLGLIACLSLASFSGCKGFMPVDDDIETNLTSDNSMGVYVMEIRRSGSKPETETKQLAEGMTLNQALVEAGVTKRRGNWEIQLIRTNPQNGLRHKMMVDYNTADRKVPVEQDYAIYPDDHIIAVPVTTNPFDDLVGGFFGSPAEK